jgi:RNA polymerase sigma-70 factor (ECF subfamily)
MSKKNLKSKNICEEEVFNELYTSLVSDLVRFIYHKFGGIFNPEDKVQEAFVALWNNCHKIAFEKAKSYLYTVANNMTLKDITKEQAANKYISRQDKHAQASDPQQILEGNEFDQRLKQALSELSEPQRVAFMLSKAEGKKHKEIAEMLGISQKAVEKRIYAAAKFLYERLGKKI